MNWFLQWFDHNALLVDLIALSALFAFLLLALLPGTAPPRARTFEWGFLLSTILVLFAWRWPAFFFPSHLQPDEGLWVAGALKATVDPRPWKGVDSTTSGPLSNYLLALPRLFGGRIDFFSMRFIGAFLIALTMFALYYAVKWTFDERIARLAIIPPVVMLSLTGNPDFIAFTSEYLPVFMTTTALAASVYLVRGMGSSRSRVGAAAIAGLFIGGSFFSKLQAAPIIAALFVLAAGTLLLEAISKTKWAAGFISQSFSEENTTIRTAVPLATRIRRRFGDMAKSFLITRRHFQHTFAACLAGFFGLCLTPAIFLICLWLSGALGDAVMSYIKMPLAYVTEGREVHFWYYLGFSKVYSAPPFAAFLISVIATVVVASTVLVRRKGLILKHSFFAFYSIFLLLSGYFAIYKAHREFPHYLWFAIVPASYCVAVALGLTREANLWSKREYLVTTLFAALAVIPQLGLAMSRPSPFAGNIIANRNTPPSRAAKAIARYARPGTRVAIWGWMPEFYIDTGTIMATRDAETALQIYPNKYRDYYRERYIRDLELHLPPLFVDAVAPGSFRHFNRADEGYETFPALARLVQEHYDLKEDVAGVRIFTLRELNSTTGPGQAGATGKDRQSNSTEPRLALSKPDAAPFALNQAVPLEEISALHDATLTLKDDQVVIVATGDDPQLLLPIVKLGPEAVFALGVDIDVPADTQAQLYYQTLKSERFSGECQVNAPLKRGPNKVWFQIPRTGLNGRFRFDPGSTTGEYILHAMTGSSSD